MVIKGKARGGASALAKHLERRDTNEVVRVMELRGVTARDVRGALREMDCMGAGAASVRTLYHAAINTAPSERLTDDQKRQAADRLEKELGFTGQPRIIVEHLKKDREHMHVVFLRIDTERMVAIPDSHNYRKHEAVARSLEREFGHQHVQGAHVEREGKERPKRTPSHHEMQQAERTGTTPQQAKEEITRLWNQTKSGRAFAEAVAGQGWVLAKGDKRDFVLLDKAGETHSLARRVEGAKAAEVRQRMADIDPASLPTVSEAKEQQRHRAEGRTKEKDKEKAKEPVSVSVSILLRVSLSKGFDPARPLQAENLSAHKAPTIEPKKTQERPKSPRPPKRTASKVQQLYTVAATATQRVYRKAKAALERKSLAEPQIVKPVTVPPPPIRPEQKPRTIQAVKSLPLNVPQQWRASPTPSAARKRMSPEELDRMIGRQRERRQEQFGPSR